MKEKPPIRKESEECTNSASEENVIRIAFDQEELLEVLNEKDFRIFREKLERILNKIREVKNKKSAINILKKLYADFFYLYRKSIYFSNGMENEIDSELFQNLTNTFSYELEGNFQEVKIPLIREIEKRVLWEKLIPEFLKIDSNKNLIRKSVRMFEEQTIAENFIVHNFISETFGLYNPNNENQNFLELFEVAEIRILFLEIMQESIERGVLDFVEKDFESITNFFNINTEFKFNLIKDLICEKILFQIILEVNKSFDFLKREFSQTELEKLYNLFFYTYSFHVFKDKNGENVYKIREYFEKNEILKQNFAEKMTNLIIQNRNQDEETLLKIIEKIYKICNLCGYDFFEIIQKGNKQIVEVKNRLYKFKNEKFVSFFAKERKLSEILEMEEEDNTSSNVIDLDKFRKKQF
jgi:hypothetical protein